MDLPPEGRATKSAGLGKAAIVAFVATRDGAKARAFYEGTLGLRFVQDDGFALVFDLAGVMLRIARVQQLAPQPFTVLGWQVPDIKATIRQLAAKGVQFERYGFFEQDELGIWTAPGGAQIAWFKDPDGNTLSLTQF